MLPASGGNLSGGCNSAGSSSYDLTSSGILLEHDFFKIHFIGWSPSVSVHENNWIQTGVGDQFVKVYNLTIDLSLGYTGLHTQRTGSL